HCCSLCPISMQRPPLRSPLFPYTTLFRSSVPLLWLVPLTLYLLTFIVAFEGKSWYQPKYLWPLLLAWFVAKGWFLADADFRLDLDRKSTRLNSSHVEISYAVFCLKKKITL